MKFQTESMVKIPGIGNVKDTRTIEFDDGSNVFGRALEYRKTMRRVFPGCEFELVKATELKA